MKWFHIETAFADHVFTRHMVKAKTFEEAAAKLQKLEGAGEYKLLGMYEPMETDKNVMKKIK